MPSTYEPIATQTLAATATSVSFTSIAATYTDLVFVANYSTNTGTGIYFRINDDPATNYSDTALSGNGTTASSSRDTSVNKMSIGTAYSTATTTTIMNIQNYANTTTNKTVLWRNNTSGNFAEAFVGLWRSTSAINRIDISPGFGVNTFSVGSTFTLYGIKAA
jgi:hypothetical protein